MRSTLSLLGLWRWSPDVLDLLQLPSELDREAVINELLLQCAEVEILYPDPDFLKQAVGAWSRIMLPIWQRLYSTTVLEYDPISNYDRHEEWSDSGSGNMSGSSSGTSGHNSSSTNTDNTTTTNGRTGFNANEGMQPAASQTSTNNSSVTGTDSINDSNETETSSTSSSSHSGRMWGNIGVTTSQQMIESERQVASYNVVQVIIRDFQDRFCILVY